MLHDIDSLSAAVNAGDGVPVRQRSPCATCHLRNEHFCGALFGNGADAAPRGTSRLIAARQNIYRAGELTDGVLVVCDGWAVRFVQLPDGRRQILSLLLPGDLVSPTAILERRFTFSIQALTAVRVCAFPPAQLRARILHDPAAFELWLDAIAGALRDAERRLVDLGQRAAQQRIAALIVHAMTRCEERGELDDEEFAFPLSQQQIADFAGLTPVHTCRVVRSLRNDGICDIGRGVVKILDRAALSRIGSLR